MDKLRILDLFSGIGGFSLGLERTGGFETVAFCELIRWRVNLLKQRWPDVPVFRDIQKLNKRVLDDAGITNINVIAGGFPCPDISHAGPKAGIDGERSGLWKEQIRLIDELRPEIALVENVADLVTGDRGRWFLRVLRDFAEVGYDAWWDCIPAAAAGAPIIRDRVWIVAIPHEINGEAWLWTVAQRTWQILQRCNPESFSARIQAADHPSRGNNGHTSRLYRPRCEAIGDSLSPIIPEALGYGILEAEGLGVDSADAQAILDKTGGKL